MLETYTRYGYTCLLYTSNPVSGLALYQVWDGAVLDEQLDLAHKPESGILLCIPRAVVIQFADAAELLDDDTVNLTLAVGRADGMCPYLVFLSCKVPELACNDGLPDKAGQLLLVIDILVLLLNAEHGGFPRTVAGTEKQMCIRDRCAGIAYGADDILNGNSKMIIRFDDNDISVTDWYDLTTTNAEQIRFYKNGRIDVRFKDSAAAESCFKRLHLDEITLREN